MKTLKLCNINKIVRGVFCMKKISEYLFLWGIGGWIYYTLEILFRGFSHWSMFVLGGICMMFFSYQGQQVHWQDDFLLQDSAAASL